MTLSEQSDSRSGITVVTLTTDQEIRGLGFAADLIDVAVTERVLLLIDPGDGREKYVLTRNVAWIEDEPEE